MDVRRTARRPRTRGQRPKLGSAPEHIRTYTDIDHNNVRLQTRPKSSSPCTPSTIVEHLQWAQAQLRAARKGSTRAYHTDNTPARACRSCVAKCSGRAHGKKNLSSESMAGKCLRESPIQGSPRPIGPRRVRARLGRKRPCGGDTTQDA